MRAGLTGISLAILATIATAQAATPATPVPPPLAPEVLRVEPMPQRTDHWIYAVNLAGVLETRIGIFDVDRKKTIGQIGAGMLPGLAQSADHRYTYIATSYYSRGSTGERIDVLEITDNSTLRKDGEVILPTKHAQQLPSAYNTTVSEDGGFLFVTNATPATSMTIIDLKARKVASEIDTAACILAYPSGPRRFTSLCESGRALTVTLDADGKEVRRDQSERFIDVENDPVYTHAQRWGKDYLFLTFGGKVTPADFSVTPARFGTPWPLVSAEDAAAGWRPGGYQPFAVHQASGRLYVGMHKGKEGSHKDGAAEIWVYDLNTHQRLARWPLAEAKLLPVLAMMVTQDANPVLVGSTGIGLQTFDARTGKLGFADRTLGHAILQLSPY